MGLLPQLSAGLRVSLSAVGLLVTIPVTIAAVTVAYQEIVGFDPRTMQTL